MPDLTPDDIVRMLDPNVRLGVAIAVVSMRVASAAPDATEEMRAGIEGVADGLASLCGEDVLTKAQTLLARARSAGDAPC